MKKLVFLIPFIVVSCISQKIAYRTDNLKASSEVTAIPINVDVHIFVDNRAQIKENEVLFNQPRNSSINGKSSCINSEKNYKKDSVSAQMTRMMVEHFNRVNLFKSVTYNHDELSDYYLTGKLNRIYGEQGFSTAAAVGAQFGLLGALATSGAKTKGKIIIDISDLKLFKKGGTLVKDLGGFYKEYNEDLSADAYCWCIYANINEKLKDFNSHLVEKLRSDLSGIQF